MDIQEIKKRKPNKAGLYWGSVQLSTGFYQLVSVEIVDEENEIVKLRTRGSRMESETGWAETPKGAYVKECFAEEVQKVFDWNYN